MRKSLLIQITALCVAMLSITPAYSQIGGIDYLSNADPDFITSWSGFGGSQVWEVRNMNSIVYSVGGTAYGGFTDGVVCVVDGDGGDAIVINKTNGEIDFLDSGGIAGLPGSPTGKAMMGGSAVSGYQKVSAGYLTDASKISIIASDGSQVRIFEFNLGTLNFDDQGMDLGAYTDVTAGFIDDPVLNGAVVSDSAGGAVWFKNIAGTLTLMASVKQSDGVTDADTISHPELGNFDGDCNPDLMAISTNPSENNDLQWYEFNGTTFVDTGITFTGGGGAGFQDISLGNDADGDGLGELFAAVSTGSLEWVFYNPSTDQVESCCIPSAGFYENVGYQRDESLAGATSLDPACIVRLVETDDGTTVSELVGSPIESDTYSLSLFGNPGGVPVTVDITTDIEVTTNVSQHVFNSGNWNSPVTVTVTSVKDFDAEGPHTGTVSHSVKDPNGLELTTFDLQVNVEDDDSFLIFFTETSGSTDVTEAEPNSPAFPGCDTYGVRLGTIPSADVTVTITPDADLTTDESELTFNTGNWFTDQPVEVCTVDDNLSEGSQVATIGHAASGGGFDGVSADLPVNVTDNEGFCDHTGLVPGGTLPTDPADTSGPTGVPDCFTNLYDLVRLATTWMTNTHPCWPGCDLE